MADGARPYDSRLRDLEAAAFRTSRTLAEHNGQLAVLREQMHTASAGTTSLGTSIGAAGNSPIAQRLDTIERQLGALEHLLHALARAQGIDPHTAD